MNKVIVSLTTIPNRLMEAQSHMGTKIGLKTILDQKYKNYEIHFNIPKIYKVTNQVINIPNWLLAYQIEYSHLKIYRTEDYGPITKILPTLERIEDPNTIIITVDDDLYYMEDMIDGHLNARKIYPNAAVGFAGIGAIDNSCHFCTSLKQDTKVKILEGYKTISYLRKFFDLNEFKNIFLDKTWRDDETLSAYMGYKNISKIVVNYDKETNFNPRVESFPVIGHTPVEQGGCYTFRNSEQYDRDSNININEWYRLGYLEK